MMGLIDSRATGVIWAIGITVGYLLGIVFAPRMLLLEVLNGMLAAISFTVMVVYGTDMPHQFKIGNDRGAWIRLGISLSWAVGWTQALGRIYFIEFAPSVTGRTFDSLIGFPAFVLILAAAAHLIAIGMQGRLVMRRNTCMVGLSLLCGFVGVLTLRIVHGFF